MNTFISSIDVRRLLMADAVISGTTGLAMIAAAGLVEPLLNIPAPWLRTAGAALLPFAAMVWYFSRPSQLTRAKAWTVIVLNVSWVAASVLVLLGGVLEPSTLGIAFVVFQAVVVAALAELQVVGLRRSSAAI
jgi:hypothetical protein